MIIPLKSDEINDVLNIFKKIYDHFLEKSEGNKEVIEWTQFIETRTIPSFLFRAESITEINEVIFSNEDLRTFILDMCFNFFSICSTGNDFIDRLCLSLENGLNIDEGNISTIPERTRESFIKSSFLEYEIEEKFLFFKVKRKVTFVNFLKSNKHFIIILLMCLVS